MALGAITATALTDHSAKAKSLWIDGLDILKQPSGTQGSLYGVELDSVKVIERFPGQVSSMTFSISDPAAVATVAEGAVVRFFDHTTSLPLFLGWVDQWSAHPAYGGKGRRIDVECTGIEALLDWCVIPVDLTFPLLTAISDAIQSMVAVCIGTGPLKAFADISGGNSSIAKGIGSNISLTLLAIPPAGGPVTITAGTTLREGIRQILPFAALTVAGLPYTNVGVATVDFFGGLRVELTGSFGNLISYADRADLTLDTGAGQRPASLDLSFDGGGAHSVYVKGANAAGTGVVGDGTGLIGATAYVSDATSQDAISLQTVGSTYLQQQRNSVRGRVTAEAVTPGSTNSTSAWFRPGSRLFVTDASVGATGSYMTSAVEKTFQASGTEDWTVDFGGIPFTAAHLIRRLTLSARA